MVSGLLAGAAGGATVTIVIQAIDKFSKTMTQAQMATKAIGVGLIAVGAAAAVGIGKAVKAANTLETAFRNVDVILGESGKAQEDFGDIARELSTTLAVQGGRVAVLDGLYQVISSGITDTEQATALLTVATKQGVAANIDMTTSVDALSAFIRGYGMDAKNATAVSGKMFKAVDLGQVTFQDLAENVGKVIPLAKAMGSEYEEVLAVFSTLSGVTGDVNQVSTQLASIYRSMLKPTQDMQDALLAIGFTSGKAAIEALGLQGTLAALKDQVGSDESAFAALFGRLEAVNAAFALTDSQAGAMSSNLDEITDSVGELDEKLNIASDTMENKMVIAMNNMKTLSEDLGAALGGPLLEGLTTITPYLESMTNWFAELDPKTQQMIGLFMILGTGLLIVAGIVALLAASAITLFVALGLLAVGGGILLGYLLNKFANFLESQYQISEKLKMIWDGFAGFMIDMWNAQMQAMEDFINFALKGLNKLISVINRIPGVNIPSIPEFHMPGKITKQNYVSPEMTGGQGNVLGYDTQGNPVNQQGEMPAAFQINITGDVFGTDPTAIGEALMEKMGEKMSLANVTRA